MRTLIKSERKKLNSRIKDSLFAIFDNNYREKQILKNPDKIKSINWLSISPMIIINLLCILAFFIKFSFFGLYVAIFLLGLRIFTITGFYHRYFSHKAFKTSRLVQFIFAFIGASAAQRGPLWWISHHRKHHKFSDQKEDMHSPIVYGFWRSHIGWIFYNENFITDKNNIKDFIQYPELRLIDRFDWFPPLCLALSLFFLGHYLQNHYPGLNTSGLQLFIWGFCISTALLYQVTFSINSLCHQWGSQRYPAHDKSRNNALLALLTFGEGWHNNHHYFPASVKQGLYWWEIDITYYILRLMSLFGLVYDLRKISNDIRDAKKISHK